MRSGLAIAPRRLGPAQVCFMRAFTGPWVACFSSERRRALSLANMGLGLSQDRGGVFLPLEIGRALACLIEQSDRGKLTPYGERLAERYRRRLLRAFPHLADDVRRARPLYRRQVAEMRELARKFKAQSA